MGEEKLEMSERERERLKVLHEVERGHLTQVEAGWRLKLSVRQVNADLPEGGAPNPGHRRCGTVSSTCDSACKR
jgi:hypothetical protein